jgi:hypothetical protein
MPVAEHASLTVQEIRSRKGILVAIARSMIVMAKRGRKIRWGRFSQIAGGRRRINHVAIFIGSDSRLPPALSRLPSLWIYGTDVSWRRAIKSCDCRIAFGTGCDEPCRACRGISYFLRLICVTASPIGYSLFLISFSKREKGRHRRHAVTFSINPTTCRVPILDAGSPILDAVVSMRFHTLPPFHPLATF